MDTPQIPPMPKKSCLINLMFQVTEDKEALDVKQHIDNAIAGIKDKRYTFQIIEA